MATPITIRRRIDQHQHPFRRALGGAWPGFAILRANINRGCGGDVSPAENGVEFRRVILGEKYIVMHQRKAGSRRLHAPGDGGQGTRGARRILGSVAWCLPQKPLRQGGHITIEDHGICGNFLSTRQAHTAGAALAGQNLSNLGPKAEFSTLGFRQALNCIRHAPHAAFHEPHAILFHMRHQHQRGRRQPGGATAIGCVASKQLAQAWVAKMLTQGIPERLHRCGADQRSDIRDAHALDQIKRGGAFGGNEGTA